MSEVKFPPEFVSQINELEFIDSEKLLASLDGNSKTSIRINSEKDLSLAVRNSPLRVYPEQLSKGRGAGGEVGWCNNGFYLTERPVFTLDPLIHAGAYYVQEASSMFLEQAIVQLELDKIPLRVLDLCAAPGGKTTHLLSLLHNDSLLVSNEVIKSRQAPLIENVIKWGKENCIVTNNDAKDFSRLKNYFDVIVCDAPCSGEGLFRKDKNAIKEWSIENVELCTMRQQRIVNDVWNTLKPGGILIYSTCTYNEKENEDNINRFCKELNADCIDLDISKFDGVVCNKKEKAVCYRFFPHLVNGEGFCLSVLKRGDGDSHITHGLNRGLYQPVDKKIKNKLADFVLKPNEKSFYAHNKNLFFINSQHEKDLALLQAALKITFTGTGLGEFKHDDFIPCHELAFSIHLNKKQFQLVDVDKQTALQILKGQTQFNFSCNDGFVLVSYQNIPFAFLKKIKNRFNNLYPKGWYIRMSID